MFSITDSNQVSCFFAQIEPTLNCSYSKFSEVVMDDEDCYFCSRALDGSTRAAFAGPIDRYSLCVGYQ